MPPLSDFNAKMHQILFPLGLSPRPYWRAYNAPTDSLAIYKGPSFKGRELEKGKGSGKGEGNEGKGEVSGREKCEV